jgi:hypothetical protein
MLIRRLRRDLQPGRALEEEALPEVIVDLGKIPRARYGTPGTWELCVGLEPLVLNHDAILLENHVVVTCSEDLTTAYQRMETVDQFARVMFIAELLGGPHVMPCAEGQKPVAASPRHGVSSQRDKVETPMRSGFAGDRVTPVRLDLTPLNEEPFPGTNNSRKGSYLQLVSKRMSPFHRLR